MKAVIAIMSTIGLMAEGHRLRSSSSASLQAEDPKNSNFLRIDNTFSDCNNPKIIDGNKVGIFSFEGAQQACNEDSSCNYFLFQRETNNVYLCHEGKGYKNSSTSSDWVMGIKPSLLHVSPFEYMVNTQAICSHAEEKTVEDAEHAVRQAEDSTNTIVINMNKDLSTEMGFMKAYFCSGSTESEMLARNGYVTLNRRHRIQAESEGPQPPKSITAPCGLNGSIQSDSSRVPKGVNEGDIVQAKRITGSEP